MAARFVEAAARSHDKHVAGLSREALVLLENADWPGNVRQLQNEIEQAVGMAADSEVLAPHHFSRDLMLAQPAIDAVVEESVLSEAGGGLAVAPSAGPVDQNALARTKTLRAAHEVWEKAYLRQALAEKKGNVSHTALALNISRVALQQKIRKYSLR